MPRPSPVSIAYQQLLTQGRLQTNPSQAALVDQLATLQQRLATTTPSTKSRSPWWPFKRSHAGSVSSNTDVHNTGGDQPSSKLNGIYIHGGVGTGKSLLADLFTSTLPVSIPSRRIHFHEFMSETHMSLHRARQSPFYTGDPLSRIGADIQSESNVLCLDEFQVSDIADAMILKRLFGAFWEAGGVMISTSNRRPEELYLNGLNRGLFLPFIDDLLAKCVVWKVEGAQDYRMGKQRQRIDGDVFFTDPQEFQKQFRQATNQQNLTRTEVQVVMGRTLAVDAVKPPGTQEKAIASSNLDCLCRTHLGASDYHALCKFASTIYLSGLHKFAADDLDTVRRFITLVDVAYESRTRIYCLSTEPLLETFKNIILSGEDVDSGNRSNSEALSQLRQMTVKGEGGSSSSMMSTFLDGVEWSATGLTKASLATGGAGETDVRFAVGRAISRLSEMGSIEYGD